MSDLKPQLQDLVIQERKDVSLKKLGLMYELIDTAHLMEILLNYLATLTVEHLNIGFLAIDDNQSDALFLIHVSDTVVVYIIDLISIPDCFVFEHCGANLKRILESSGILKVFFDSNTIAKAKEWNCFLENVLCLQAEVKSFGIGQPEYFDILDEYLQLSFYQKSAIQAIRNRALPLLEAHPIVCPRPFPVAILAYCTVTVAYHDNLANFLSEKRCGSH